MTPTAQIKGSTLALTVAGLMACAVSQASGLFFYKFTPIADTRNSEFERVGGLPAMNDSGRIVFDATLPGGVEGVFSHFVVNTLDTYADSTSTNFGGFTGAVSVNDLHVAAFVGVKRTNPHDIAILRGDGSTIAELISDASSDPNHLRDFCGLQINDAGSVVFRATRADGTHEIRTQADGALTGVHREIAHEGGGNFDDFSALSCSVSIADDGTVAFTGHQFGENAIFTAETDGLLTRWLGTSNLIFASFGDLAITRAGRFAFTAQRLGGGLGVFRIRDGLIATVMDPFQLHPPGVPSSVSLNESGTVAFGVARPGNGSDVFLGPNSLFGRIAGTGMMIQNRVVRDTHISHDSLNAAGEIAVSFDFFDGTHMIAHGRPVNLLSQIVYTGGVVATIVDDAGSVATGTLLPPLPKGAQLTFDLTFVSPDSRLDVKLGEQVVQSVRATDIGVRRSMSVPLDAELAKRGLQFVLNGAKGASAQIAAITVPGLSDAPLDADALSKWQFDDARGAVVVTNVGRYPANIQVAVGTPDPKKPAVAPVSAALLSDDGVDATTDLLMSSLRVSGVAPRACKVTEVNGDGRYDLLCQADLPAAVLKTGTVSLEAMTQSGWGIEGVVKIGATRLTK